MTPHDRVLELLTLPSHDEDAADVLQSHPDINDSIVGFHYQQAAEKMLKALLAAQNIDFPRTHDLEQRMELADGAGYKLPVSSEALEELTPFAVTLRYEMDDASGRLDWSQVRDVVQQLRVWLERELEQL